MGASLSATRNGNVLTLYVTPFSDSTTGHTGSGFSQGIFGPAGHISGSYRIDVNGAVIAAGNAVGNAVKAGPGFATQVNLPAKPSTVAFTLNAARTGALYPLSTASTTTWTWPSAAGPGISLPPGWSCADGTSSCEVEPLLTVGYDVAGIAVDGTAAAGAQVVKLTFGHQQFATASAVTSSAACPRCHILVVEADSPAITDLAAAENTAVRLGAAAVSNSYGTRENGLALVSARAYDHPGHAIVVASGDYGYTAASFPADLATVTAVGGTELSRARNERGWLETVWNEFGVGASSSGCSAYVSKPRWQHDPHCPGRTVADVAALAWDIAIYDRDYCGWVEVAGTSASSPIIAGIYGLAGNAARIKPGYEYAHTRSLFDVTAGDNDWFFLGGGRSCGYDYLCVAKKGYDAPTGLGTPDGTGAF